MYIELDLMYLIEALDGKENGKQVRYIYIERIPSKLSLMNR